MDAAQENELISLGNCQLHWHESDRVMTHDRINDFQRNMRVVSKNAAYAVTYDDDVVYCTGSATFTLPLARDCGKELTFVVKTAATTMTLARSGSDTILGAVSISRNTQWLVLKLKAAGNEWLPV